MIQKKRTEITIETDRIVVISGRSHSARAWCKSCGRQVTMVTVDDAARLARVSSRTIFRWVEDEKLHFTERPDGCLLVCYESIPLSKEIIMRTRKILIALLTFGVLAASAGIWGTSRVSATQPQREYASFGMVGVTGGQTIRLNVVNAEANDPRLPPNPCIVQLNFVDGSGNTIAESTETLTPGQATILDVDGSDLIGRVGNRAEVRAFVQVVAESRVNRLPPNPCVSTLEVFETATGNTALLYPGTMLQQSLSDRE
jgi:hypothetical protein